MIRTILCFLCVLLSCGATFGAPLPSSFDLRNLNGHAYIGPVRDQDSCGSCYSFGALAAAESAYNRHHDLYDASARDFSEAFVIWSLGPLYSGFGGCDGASYDYEELTALVTHGVPLESDFPYVITDPGPDNHHWDDPRIGFADWQRIPPNDIETAKRIIQRFGAIDAAVWVDNAFQNYSGSVFQNTDTSVNSIVPYYSSTNHAIALVGWEDDPGDGGMGYWILRNSWGETWGEDGYMRLRYTAAKVSLESTYLLVEPWGGDDVHWSNAGHVQGTPWNSGGLTNAHAVDLWTGSASTVTNTGTVSATVSADANLATARGVYFWGGPQGRITNSGVIRSEADSLQNQAVAYGACAQTHQVRNAGQILAEAAAPNDQAMAFGVWLFNGGNDVDLQNTGEISVQARGPNALAYGAWTDSRSGASIVNTGQILVGSSGALATGLLLTGGPANITNTGRIQATAESGAAIGIAAYGDTILTNAGEIIASGAFAGYAVLSDADANMGLILQTGSELSGRVSLLGDNDYVALQGQGSEDDMFTGVETLLMNGDAWSLTGSSAFGEIRIQQGVLGINGPISGVLTVESPGTLVGSETLIGDVFNFGTVAPGNSIGVLTIDGDYMQTADAFLETEVGDGAADLLIITGTADLQGGVLQVVPDGYATAGDHTFLTAGTLVGAFDRIDTPAVLNATVSTPAPDALALNITRNTYQSLAANQDQSHLAALLDSVRPSATGDMAHLLNQVDRLTLGPVHQALADLTPQLHGAAGAMGLANARRTMDHLLRGKVRSRYLQHRKHDPSPLQRLELACADTTTLRLGPLGDARGTRAADASRDTSSVLWFDSLGAYTKYERTAESPAFREKMWGAMVGLDYRINDRLTGGVAGAYTETRLDQINSQSRIENDAYRGYLYGLWDDPTDAGGIHAETVLGFGHNRFRADRSIAFLDRSADSRHNGQDYSFRMGVGYDWVADGWTLGPTLGAAYVRLHEQGYTESGAAAADLKIASHDSDSLLSLLGLRVTRHLLYKQTLLIPELRADWIHDYLAGAESISSRLISTGTGFRISGRDMAQDTLALGAGLKFILNDRVTGYLDYDCTLQGSDGYTAHEFHAGLKIQF